LLTAALLAATGLTAAALLLALALLPFTFLSLAIPSWPPCCPGPPDLPGSFGLRSVSMITFR
jgi:hypothetical protein